jgi:hypothetical protein
MGLGAGAVSSTFKFKSTSYADMNVRGGGAGIDLWMGGTLLTGLVLGGALVVNSADKAQDRESGLRTGVSQTMLLVFVDGFPSPTGGFDFGGGIGLAGTNSPSNSENPAPDTSGVGLGIWGGYTAWVADNWSVGGLARLGLARTSTDSDGGVDSNSLSFVLEFSALYH